MEPARSSALIRATLFVRSLERATTFYRALGLGEVYYEGVLDDPSACSILGFSIDKPYPVRILKRPGPNYGMIGLFELPPELKAAAIPAAAGPARLGEVALVFYVASMAATLAELRAAGATWSPEPRVFVMKHRQQAEVCLRDCDGVLINLVETDPNEQESTRPEA
jgi:catechol 2,3-dioxygenase-like lactoylglutathione lyase family enzyme